MLARTAGLMLGLADSLAVSLADSLDEALVLSLGSGAAPEESSPPQAARVPVRIRADVTPAARILIRVFTTSCLFRRYRWMLLRVSWSQAPPEGDDDDRDDEPPGHDRQPELPVVAEPVAGRAS